MQVTKVRSYDVRDVTVAVLIDRDGTVTFAEYGQVVAVPSLAGLSDLATAVHAAGGGSVSTAAQVADEAVPA